MLVLSTMNQKVIKKASGGIKKGEGRRKRRSYRLKRRGEGEEIKSRGLCTAGTELN